MAPETDISKPEAVAAIQRRTLRVVVASQVLGGAGLAAGITVGALLAEQMLGSQQLAGVPAALMTTGAAVSAFLVGRLTQRRGRRVGLVSGFAAGGLGGLGVVTAAALGSVPLLLGAFLLYGAGTATNLQARYAGTDLALPDRRGTAVSVAMVSTTLGAVAGPNLVAPLGELATRLGLPALAGPFLLAGAAFLAAGAVLLVLLRPDPYLVAQRLDAATAPSTDHVPGPVVAPGRGVAVGATVMVLTQVAMVAIMTMTPVHMRAHHHDLTAVGLVIGIHVGAMFLPSLVTGPLVDRVGRIPMAIASAVTLLLAGVTAALAPADSMPLLIVALALLGLGWNFGLIAGTALVVDATVPANRARTQGSLDVLVALGGAGGGAMSGVVMAATSYATLSLIGGVLSLLLLPVLLWTRRPVPAPV
ncbi:putative MFS-type transporter YdeG [Cellulomonas algicola]|uniref:Putative MFS-type transporter YdeG n=1 Tax=Cellulomonas algicola TaxID=2071633 RepID=A0A401UVK8_9CELL|nr:MFS transporter [Cellulomonas algicola]GCD18604.1 putative MFS-type transporter YdeG [Cellulomonas algicola]